MEKKVNQKPEPEPQINWDKLADALEKQSEVDWEKVADALEKKINEPNRAKLRMITKVEDTGIPVMSRTRMIPAHRTSPTGKLRIYS